MAWGMAALAGGNLIGNAMAQNTAKSEARKNRGFQERMARKSYRYAVDDMKKAGLNPALAYSQGGAATPSGAVADTVNPMDGVSETVQNSAKIGVQQQLAKEQVKSIRQGAATQLSQEKLNEANAAKSITEAKVLSKEVPYAKIKGDFGKTLQKLIDHGKNAARPTSQPITPKTNINDRVNRYHKTKRKTHKGANR